MNQPVPPTMVERRLRTSAILVIVGLVIELFSLYWAHPTSFLFFVAVGGAAMAAGIGWFLLTLVPEGG